MVRRDIIASYLMDIISQSPINTNVNLLQEIGDRKHFGFDLTFLVFFLTILETIQECKRELKDYESGMSVTIKERRDRRKLPEYFENPEDQNVMTIRTILGDIYGHSGARCVTHKIESPIAESDAI